MHELSLAFLLIQGGFYVKLVTVKFSSVHFDHRLFGGFGSGFAVSGIGRTEANEEVGSKLTLSVVDRGDVAKGREMILCLFDSPASGHVLDVNVVENLAEVFFILRCELDSD